MKNLVLTLVAAAALNTAVLSAQPNEIKVTKNQTASLCNAIKSENTGLRRSAIYMAGKYQMSETTATLIEQLKNEKDSRTKVLIALSLYKIGDKEGLEAVEYLAARDNDREVRRMSRAIIDQIEMDRVFDTASIK